MTAIETKEIKGMSIKTVITIIIATATIVTSILMTTARLSAQIVVVDNKIEFVKMRSENDSKLNELRMKIMERRLDIMEETLNNLKKQK